MGRPFMDVRGVEFGRLTARERVPDPRRGGYWRCDCSCGGSAVVRLGGLRAGNTRSCGCLRRESITALGPLHADSHAFDLTGRPFGLLTPRRRVSTPKGQQGRHWLCDCACGGVTIARVKDLTLGNTRSCGCLRRVGYGLGRGVRVDIEGMTFGLLTPREVDEGRRGRGAWWRCDCACGGSAVVRASILTSGHTRSCGCLARGQRRAA